MAKGKGSVSINPRMNAVFTALDPYQSKRKGTLCLSQAHYKTKMKNIPSMFYCSPGYQQTGSDIQSYEYFVSIYVKVFTNQQNAI
ncbi:hypothetical protein [Salibacterium lacus]|uniref:Uncharacterized protein n=1 Tax=Salibacterium lacus TaxID=1898109 RepID=A0ABW5T439_9BACI